MCVHGGGDDHDRMTADDRLVVANLCSMHAECRGRQARDIAADRAWRPVRSQKETCQGGSETRCTAGFPFLLGNPREVNGLPWQDANLVSQAGRGRNI